MKEYILRQISGVHVFDANGNELPSDMVDSLGVSLLTGEAVQPPTLGPAIADRTYVVGAAPVTIDLSQRFLGAISYGMSPTNIPGVTRSGAIVTIDPATTRATTAITVSGANAGGTVSMTFNLTVNAASPTLTAALPDRSLTVGDAAVTLALGDYFANAASYSVSPTGQGVSISGSTTTISAAAERNGTYTVTASNSTGQTVSDAFALVVAAAVVTPTIADIPDQTMTVGDADRVIALTTTNAQSISVSPAGAGVTATLSQLTISAAAERDATYTVTVTSNTGHTASDTFALLVEAAAPVSAQRVILVSDYAGDCDDAAALAIVAKAHQDGDINLLGVVASSTVATSAPGLRGQLNAYGLQSIPVYAYQGSTGTYNDTFSFAVRDQFGIPGQTRTAFQDDVVGLRTMLAAAPDASVKVIDVGAPVSGARLLDSPADAISPLTGMQLVAAKVIGLWQMAGEFTTTRVEYNADRHIPSTQRVYQDWPTPVIAHGAEVGADLFTGAGPSTSIESDPVKMAFVEFDKAYSGLNSADKRQSWDPACAYHAIYGDSGLFGYGGQNGTITVSASGVTSFSATPAGNRSIVAQAAPIATIEAAMQAVIDSIAIPMPAIDFTVAFDEGTGTVITAEEGAPVFTMSAGATWLASPAHIDFNGTNGRLTTPGNDRFVAYDMLMGAVFRVDTTGTRIISAVNGTQGRVYQFRTNGDLEYVSIAPDTTATVISSTPNPTVGQWALGVAFVTDTSVVLRLNGAQVGAGTFPQRGKVMGTHPLVLGARSFDGVAFSDHLDGGIAAYRHKTGAVAADIAAFEASLRAIATAKGIILP